MKEGITMPTCICSFRKEYSFLSNFYSCPVVFEGVKYSSSEVAFQAAKLSDPADRIQFNGLNAKDAKRLGHVVKLRDDWANVCNDIMLSILRDKFTRTPALGQMLLETGDAYLIEGNYWHDNYWGHCTCSRCAHKPHMNTLGILLMQVRYELR